MGETVQDDDLLLKSFFAEVGEVERDNEVARSSSPTPFFSPYLFIGWYICAISRSPVGFGIRLLMRSTWLKNRFMHVCVCPTKLGFLLAVGLISSPFVSSDSYIGWGKLGFLVLVINYVSTWNALADVRILTFELRLLVNMVTRVGPTEEKIMKWIYYGLVWLSGNEFLSPMAISWSY